MPKMKFRSLALSLRVFHRRMNNSRESNEIHDLFPLEDLLETVLVEGSPSKDAEEESSSKMSQPEAACRLKFLRAEMPDENMPKGAQISDLTCAVNVKEKVEVNGRCLKINYIPSSLSLSPISRLINYIFSRMTYVRAFR
jgi:hypothetical protein